MMLYLSSGKAKKSEYRCELLSHQPSFFYAVSGEGFAVAVFWSNYPATARFKKKIRERRILDFIVIAALVCSWSEGGERLKIFAPLSKCFHDVSMRTRLNQKNGRGAEL